MLFNLWQNINNEINTIQFMLIFINAILHIIFAGAVAKDAGQFTKTYGRTHLVSSVTWAFATLVGGPLVAVGYWFMHHMNNRRAS